MSKAAELNSTREIAEYLMKGMAASLDKTTKWNTAPQTIKYRKGIVEAWTPFADANPEVVEDLQELLDFLISGDTDQIEEELGHCFGFPQLRDCLADYFTELILWTYG